MFIRRFLMPAVWCGAVLGCIGTFALARWYAPIEATMGPVQKVLYLHLPSAIAMFAACVVVFLASIGYLWQRKLSWDALALAAAELAVSSSTIVLLTGMFWGRVAWGHWWTWSPRLTFSLILWILYLIYLVIRPKMASPHRRALAASLYGTIAFLDVPLVYLSVKLLPDIHPADSALTPEMRHTLLAALFTCALLCFAVLRTLYRHHVQATGTHAGSEDSPAPPAARLS